ncbi:uncharacterized protein I206_106177 [Kwoniella pini CBS 10737]|uniref:Uncharacterized protein n=1 Tax=Kwoniella pini CBS 10737 TaxID=1296096 RepID=A0A1B9I1I2_9TREE|nr:uncharacterized protein I206_05002 [Kwoniella pini CBS 10737]OCF49311.1 hypothetical protein I206_05002 [Kwoniella pini CBS 10737]
MPSICTPITSRAVPRIRRRSMIELPVRSAVLAEILQKRGVITIEIEGSIVEFVIKAWKEGKTVRNWCQDIQQVLEAVTITETLEKVVGSPSFLALLPFVNLPSIAYLATAEPPFPPPLIPSESLRDISLSHLTEALTELLLRNQAGGSRPFCDEPLIHELCLSYISSIWRKSSLHPRNTESMIDSISKDLTEVEFELRLNSGSSHTIDSILQIFHDFRFHLGFVTSSQLITRIYSKSQHALLASGSSFTESLNLENEAANAEHFYGVLCAWVDRRLSVGLSYHTVISELNDVKSKLEDIDHQVLIEQILGCRFSALGERANEGLSTDQSGLLWCSPSSPTNSITNHSSTSQPQHLYSQLTSPSLTSLFTFRMGRKRSLTSHAPKWLYHKRNASSPNKLRGRNSDQSRPTSNYFPEVPLATGSDGNNKSSSDISFEFPLSDHTIRLSTVSSATNQSRPQTTFKDVLTSSLMSLADPEDVRTVLLNQLMEMRYHIHGHEDEGWFLGGGREEAEELMLHLEKKMIGKKDLMGFKGIFDSMRSAFDLPPSIDSNRNTNTMTTYSINHQGTGSRTVDQSENRSTLDLDRFFDEVAKLPDTIQQCSVTHIDAEHQHHQESKGKQTHKRRSDTLSLATKRDEGNLVTGRESGSTYSMSTMTSFLTTESTDETRISSFEIQEAHKEYQEEIKAIEYHFPLPPSTPPHSSVANEAGIGKLVLSAWQPDFSESNERYTRLPPRINDSRRGRTRRTSVKKHSQEGSSTRPSPRDETLKPLPPSEAIVDVVDAYSSAEPLSPLSPSLKSAEDSPSRSTFDTHILTPTSVRYPYMLEDHHQALSTLSSQATLFNPHDTPSQTQTLNRRRASLGQTDKNRRQMHRHCAVFDGKVSPSKELNSLSIDVEKDQADLDPITPIMRAIHLSNDSDENLSRSTCNPRTEEGNEDTTPKVQIKRSSRVANTPKKKLSFMGKPIMSDTFLASRSRKSNVEKKLARTSPVPLTEVLALFAQHQHEKELSSYRVEAGLIHMIEIERSRVENAGEEWDEAKKGRMKWLIEQVAVILGDPIYVAPISRVIDSLNNCSQLNLSQLNLSQPRSPSPQIEQSRPSEVFPFFKRPTLSRYQSQPQFSTSFLSSPPRPESIRPNILKRHTQQCLSITSLDSAPSIYSLPSADGEEETELEINKYRTDFPAPSIRGMLINSTAIEREDTEKRNMRLSKGYEEWDIPMPQRLEWPIPIPHIRHVYSDRRKNNDGVWESESPSEGGGSVGSKGSTDTFGVR